MVRLEKSGEFVGGYGCRIGKCIKDAVGILTELNAILPLAECGDMFQDGFHATFNGVKILFAPDSDPSLLYRDFRRAVSGHIEGPIGPYPNKELTSDEIANDERKKLENEIKAKARAEKWRQKREEERRKLAALLERCPPMEFKDEAAWLESKAANHDAYGGGVLNYAEKWARLMQKSLTNGATIAECAEQLSHVADDEGITGFMYGCAVSLLAQCWVHGEELRRWHNKDTQIGTEGDEANERGGTLNPAMLSIG
jgi:hypothetical protein